MLKKYLFYFLLLIAVPVGSWAQGGYTIKLYEVAVTVNQDASLDITETIHVNFSEQRHGIYRMIPYKYQMVALAPGMEKADRRLESGGMAKTIIEDISVTDRNYEVSTEGYYKKIKIGDGDVYVSGDQEYVIHYKLLNAINFFTDKSELYFNLIGDRWDTNIDSVSFSISLYNALPATPKFFVATGYSGSTDNKTTSAWVNNKIFNGSTNGVLQAREGLTVGIVFPKGFLIQQNYMMRGFNWVWMPLAVLIGMFLIWRRWGKDEKLTIATEFYPPGDVSPGIAGYIIDGVLNRRDLTALIPYWGGGGYIRVVESQESALLGLIKTSEYEFIKLKELPATAMSFEKTMFDGIFKSGDRIFLSSLKNVFHTTMTKARKELESEVTDGNFYKKYSRGMGCLFMGVGSVFLAVGVVALVATWGDPLWMPLSFISCAFFIIGFGIFMGKKSPKGNELYRKLAGFKEFIKSVEKDRLAMFLKEDQHYFNKVLPFAIVFDVADTWKDKLKGLDVPPPDWYSGNFHGFTTAMFLNKLDSSMNAMSSSFYSTPASSGSSGGSWSGGGGSSGGGFGGGGFGSW